MSAKRRSAATKMADEPAERLPTALVVHGGPWGRDIYGYRPDHQGWPTAASRFFR